jgi:hypothetical protein
MARYRHGLRSVIERAIPVWQSEKNINLVAPPRLTNGLIGKRKGSFTRLSNGGDERGRFS